MPIQSRHGPRARLCLFEHMWFNIFTYIIEHMPDNIIACSKGCHTAKLVTQQSLVLRGSVCCVAYLAFVNCIKMYYMRRVSLLVVFQKFFWLGQHHTKKMSQWVLKLDVDCMTWDAALNQFCQKHLVMLHEIMHSPDPTAFGSTHSARAKCSFCKAQTRPAEIMK